MYFMYLMYNLDMFHILNFAFVLWIYGTLNKMNELMNIYSSGMCHSNVIFRKSDHIFILS